MKRVVILFCLGVLAPLKAEGKSIHEACKHHKVGTLEFETCRERVVAENEKQALKEKESDQPPRFVGWWDDIKDKDRHAPHETPWEGKGMGSQNTIRYGYRHHTHREVHRH